MDNQSKVELIQNEVDLVINLWKEKHPKLSVWWNSLTNFIPSIKFLINSTDYFVSAVEDKIPDGATKKTTVMSAIMVLYDTAVSPLIPLYLKPFGWQIKLIVLSVINILIDFIVSKYNDGNWNMKNNIKNFV